MGYIRRLALIAFSTFIPFVLLAKLENTYIPYQAAHITALHQITLYDLKVFFSSTMPLWYVLAILCQALLIVPAWNKIISNRNYIFIVFTDILSIVLCFSFAVSYLIWDRADGLPTLMRSVEVLSFVQLLYWVFNFTTLYLVRKFSSSKPQLAVDGKPHVSNLISKT